MIPSKIIDELLPDTVVKALNTDKEPLAELTAALLESKRILAKKRIVELAYESSCAELENLKNMLDYDTDWTISDIRMFADRRLIVLKKALDNELEKLNVKPE